MKYFFAFLCLLLLFILPSQGQNAIQFPDSNARWVNYSLDQSNLPLPSIPTYTIYCMDGKDTIFNGSTYGIVSLCGGSHSNNGYVGGIRDSLGQVFFIAKDSSSEMLLYDFTVEVGDSLTDIFGTPTTSANPIIISAIDSIQLDGIQHKRIHIQNGFDWIEGIGNTAGLFQPSFIPLSVSWSLHCMSRDSLSFSGFGTGIISEKSGNCSLTVGAQELSYEGSDIVIYPNPSKDRITISPYKPGTEVMIFDIEGRLVKKYRSATFSIRDFQPAVYLIEVRFKNQTAYTKLMKE